MNCSDARPLLDLLVDNVLDTKDTALVMDHLKSCEPCHGEYSAMEALRGRFNIAKEQPQMMPSLMAKMSATLKDVEKAEQQKRMKSKLRLASGAIAAVAVVAIGIFAVPKLQNMRGEQSLAQAASADVLINDLTADANVQPVPDRNQLASKLGYEPKYLKLQNWRMDKVNVYAASSSVLARFDFVGTGPIANQQMTCYQARQGAIKASSGERKQIGDKRVTFGNRGKYHFALWSQNGRDYLLVSQQQQLNLEDIVKNG